MSDRKTIESVPSPVQELVKSQMHGQSDTRTAIARPRDPEGSGAESVTVPDPSEVQAAIAELAELQPVVHSALQLLLMKPPDLGGYVDGCPPGLQRELAAWLRTHPFVMNKAWRRWVRRQAAIAAERSEW